MIIKTIQKKSIKNVWPAGLLAFVSVTVLFLYASKESPVFRTTPAMTSLPGAVVKEKNILFKDGSINDGVYTSNYYGFRFLYDNYLFVDNNYYNNSQTVFDAKETGGPMLYVRLSDLGSNNNWIETLAECEKQKTGAVFDDNIKIFENDHGCATESTFIKKEYADGIEVSWGYRAIFQTKNGLVLISFVTSREEQAKYKKNFQKILSSFELLK